MIELFELFNNINNLHSRYQTESQPRQSRQLTRIPRTYSIDRLDSKVLVFKDNSINSTISASALTLHNVGLELSHRNPEGVRIGGNQ